MAGPTFTRRDLFRKFAQKYHLPPQPAPAFLPVDEGFAEVNTLTISGGLTPYNGPWAYEQAAHLLRRISFGATKSQVEALEALGSADAAVDRVLDVPTNPPAPPINNYNNPELTDPVVQPGETWVTAPIDFNAEVEFYRIESWRGWWINLMVESPPDIQEKMTLFWHNHFAVRTEAVFFGRVLYQHNQLLRQNALGNFKSLVKAVTLDPAMLVFLNGYLNAASAPDENYARELQELFTIGKDNPDHYTEEDVQEAARVLTGWRINVTDVSSFFNPLDHDFGQKKFSAFYNGTVINGNLSGSEELDDLLNMIFQKNEVALYTCRKLYRFFVYYKIDTATETNVIEPLAQIFRDNNYDIRPVMEALLKSEHFFNALNTGCYIKNPLDHVLGTLRNFNTSLPGSTLYDEWLMRLYINYFTGTLQMLPGDPPNVAGWPAYRQSPAYYRYWITGDTLRNRNVYTDALTLANIPTENDMLKIDHIAFAAQFDNPQDPNALLDDMLRLLLPMPISAVKKNLLKSILLSGQANDAYWTTAWNDYVNNPSNQMAYDTVWFRLAFLHKYILNLPEFQLA
jgi:uncharacterized protein (DUF1800 family)